MKKEKSSVGRFFEDYELGETIRHATPRTLTEGDRSLYIGIYSSRYTTYCSSEFAKEIGFKGCPLEDLLVFHTVFGKTVPDIWFDARQCSSHAMEPFHTEHEAGSEKQDILFQNEK